MNAVLQERSLLLATDLDGTFLAGDPTSRQQLYRLIGARDDLDVAWVTGRGRDSVLPLLEDPALPKPKYLICDVGATVLHGSDLQPIQPLQARIDARWPGESVVSEAMRRFPQLQRQEVPQERRCSYYCDPKLLRSIRAEIESVAESLGCQVLYSADRYLDILPRHTGKGSTLSALVETMRLRRDRVLVAGDTLNDLSMYLAGFNGVCVGASEPALTDATAGLSHVLHAQAPGCGGILQAMEHFGLVPAALESPPTRAAGEAKLVMVYHRLPYEERVVRGERVRRPHSSPNGIIPSLLSFFADGTPGSWVAWTTAAGPGVSEVERMPVDSARYPGLTAATVALNAAEVETFYKRFSKEAFWPVINTFWERAKFDEDDWKVFLRVNHRFAEAAAMEAAPGATVWLHDYNLWMVPAVLRQLRPDLKIAFFHHTQFPAADIFNILPWRKEILGSLLACDYVGFHIPRHAENFVDAVRGTFQTEVLSRSSCSPRFMTFGCAVGVEDMATELVAEGRRVRIGAHPIGTDLQRIRNCLGSAEHQGAVERIQEQLNGRKLILSIERLDYTKGILEKLEAFEQLLDESPELLGQVTLVVVCVPAAKGMNVYRSLQRRIEQLVGRINGRLSRLDWTPVRFFARVLPFPTVVSYYSAADVMWITPLRDGLNLVAKEFVATQGLAGKNAVLVLSEFAGAAAELKGALLTNPHDKADLAKKLRQALHMSSRERAQRQEQLFHIVKTYDLSKWGQGFLEAVREESGIVYALDQTGQDAANDEPTQDADKLGMDGTSIVGSEQQ